MEDYQKAKIILLQYKKKYPEAISEGVKSPKTSVAPFHPVTTFANADSKVMHHFEERIYCEMCEEAINKMSPKDNYPTLAAILYNKYLVTKNVTDAFQIRTMHTSPRHFYDKLKKALDVFSKVCSDRNFDDLYNEANKQAK